MLGLSFTGISMGRVVVDIGAGTSPRGAAQACCDDEKREGGARGRGRREELALRRVD